jgi:hypothetical protein
MAPHEDRFNAEQIDTPDAVLGVSDESCRERGWCGWARNARAISSSIAAATRYGDSTLLGSFSHATVTLQVLFFMFWSQAEEPVPLNVVGPSGSPIGLQWFERKAPELVSAPDAMNPSARLMTNCICKRGRIREHERSG